MTKTRTAEKIGRHSSPAGRRDCKKTLARARRANERRALREGSFDALALRATNRDYLAGWND